jgi:hypothetical protein
VNQEERTARARLGAHESWARTTDPSARTAAARKAAQERFEKQVDPDGLLTPEERTRRAEHARKAFYARMQLASATARRKKAAAAETPAA